MVRLLPGSARSASLLGLAVLLVLTLFVTLPPAMASRQQSPDQDKSSKDGVKDKDTGKLPSPKQSEKLVKEKLVKTPKGVVRYSPVEVVAETALYAYGGREPFKEARASLEEQGNIRIATEQGDVSGTLTIRRVQKEKSWEDLLRTDVELDLPDSAQRADGSDKINYVMAFNGASVWAAQNGQYITPAAESEAAFRSQLAHDYTTLLRYKEDGSKIELVGPETVVGIETNVVDLTSPSGEKTRFWVSARTYRILHMEYEIKLPSGTPSKVRISYYPPYKVVQNTLVPTRITMEQDGKFVQEVNITSIVTMAKIDPEAFMHLP